MLGATAVMGPGELGHLPFLWQDFTHADLTVRMWTDILSATPEATPDPIPPGEGFVLRVAPPENAIRDGLRLTSTCLVQAGEASMIFHFFLNAAAKLSAAPIQAAVVRHLGGLGAVGLHLVLARPRLPTGQPHR